MHYAIYEHVVENIDIDKIEGPVNTCCCHFASSLSTWPALSPSPLRHPPV